MPPSTFFALLVVAGVIVATVSLLMLRRSDAHPARARRLAGPPEVKVGRLADASRYIATIEPWHGFQVVIYTPPTSGTGLWERRVIDEPVAGGHALWCTDLDGDGDQELIVGSRDKGTDPSHAASTMSSRPWPSKSMSWRLWIVCSESSATSTGQGLPAGSSGTV